MEPTRAQIQEKINELIKDETVINSKENFKENISKWLDSLKFPQTKVVVGVEINIKQQILDDLDSYEGF